MITNHDANALRAFTEKIAIDFNAGMIRAPVHLSGGNEEPLIDIFQAIRPQDWVLTTWRSHYHCLLKGVPPQRLREDILAGRSITLCYPDYRIVSSAIVGGICPIAVGIGLSIKRYQDDRERSNVITDKSRGEPYPRVWCFVGDMAAETGIFSECVRYALAHDLPIRFIVESNEKSVGTPTSAVWGSAVGLLALGNVTRYRYTLPWPHSGAGKRVEF